jgi:hypothetical protein
MQAGYYECASFALMRRQANMLRIIQDSALFIFWVDFQGWKNQNSMPSHALLTYDLNR